MGSHPLNLTLRFILELIALYAMGYWGWSRHTGWLRLILTIGLPLTAAALWGTFRVPGDVGKVPVAVPGIARLMMEAAFFGAAVWSLYAADQVNWAWIYAAVVVVHYLLSYDRVGWLLKQ